METSQHQPLGGAVGVEGLPPQIAGMSKQHLYDVMSQMKTLIDDDQEHAREVLINNPALTRALFQAQIMLGMVKDPNEPPKVATDIQQAVIQSQPSQVAKPSIAQNMLPSSVQSGIQDRITLPQPPTVAKQQNIAELSRSLLSASSPAMPFQQPTLPANHPLPSLVKGFHLPPVPSAATPQTSQLLNVTLPSQLPSQYSTFPSHVPVVTTQQQPLKNHGVFNHLLQPPLPQMPRPHSMQSSFPHLMNPQVPNSLGLHPSGAPQQLLPQSVFHSGGIAHAPLPTGQPPLTNQPPPQQLYQGGSHIGIDYNSQAGTSMQFDRSAPWSRVHQDATASGLNFHGQLPLVPGQMTHGVGGSQPPQPQKQLTPDMEKVLIQQVLSMTPEQVSLLPAEQRQQVLQLQEMLRP